MSRRRPGISAGHGSLGWIARSRFKRELQSSDADRPVMTVELAPPPILRTVHPVVPTTHSRWFRVIRLFKTRDGLQVEDIGEFPHMTEAILLGSREVGRARVLDDNGKLVSDNGQTIESRA